MTILSLIVARGGSKRIPRKNLQEINGLSLLGYKAKACPQAIVSTDDEEISAEAIRYGLQVLVRPGNLALDTVADRGDCFRRADGIGFLGRRWMRIGHGDYFSPS